MEKPIQKIKPHFENFHQQGWDEHKTRILLYFFYEVQ